MLQEAQITKPLCSMLTGNKKHVYRHEAWHGIDLCSRPKTGA